MTDEEAPPEPYVLSARSRALLASVTGPLLSRCGATEGRPANTLRIRSFKEAFEEKRHFDWENAKLTAEGNLTVHLHNEHYDRYHRWNKIGAAISALLIPAVD